LRANNGNKKEKVQTKKVQHIYIYVYVGKQLKRKRDGEEPKGMTL